MSKRNKLMKFAEILSFPNVYENFEIGNDVLTHHEGTDVQMKGNWHSVHFNNNNPITLELACGGGEYSVALAQRYPDRNFIGVDIKGARIWKGARRALAEGLHNVAFLRTRIEQIAQFFAPYEVSEIWITFPDPFLANSRANRRLTSPQFHERYRQFLHTGGLVHLKTDSPELYDFTLLTLAEDEKCTLIYQNNDIYSGELVTDELDIKTHYEKIHLSKQKTIKYIKYIIN
ncbi:MAG: tRNA (guanosine(46)-N7)-methyltransferase TrmB [Saprospiraceae bacterium]|nr:tRNA (guanosine(46)-N7)-methyltransferase TrmB [Saprospiraceae bacterium]MBP7679625.1 tRNA (guanosine(46)-N7)-methyltransferase TrmB [Saprospiraceae bacterium]